MKDHTPRSLSVEAITPHPLNALIYSDGPDEALVENIRAIGILQPLILNADNQLISGHRRLAAAIAAGYREVPVVNWAFDSEEEEAEALILANAQRERTNEQRAREAAVLLPIEERRAKERQANHGAAPGRKANTSGNISGSVQGEARDLVASRVGRSGRWIADALAVVKEIDARREAGDEAGAAALSAILNESAARALEMIRSPLPAPEPPEPSPEPGGPAPAKKAAPAGGGKERTAEPVIPDGPEVVCGLGLPVPEPLRDAMLAAIEVETLLQQLRHVEKTVSRLCEEGRAPALRRACQITGEGDARKFVLQSLRAAVTTVKMAIPYTLCPYCYEVCPGRALGSCEHCSGTGIVTKDKYQRAEARLREAVEGRAS
jgi:hypothetical protein